ncbi:MAG: hypothetical protein B6I19_08910 [Bacteroidetes bacterium 4572_114]|nr:MAG: hypothetical protein B6I19_08910 [Bacteroidetes bacterium 4572_114]
MRAENIDRSAESGEETWKVWLIERSIFLANTVFPLKQNLPGLKTEAGSVQNNEHGTMNTEQ